MNNKLCMLFGIGLILSFNSCKKPISPITNTNITTELKVNVIKNYVNMVLANYQDALTTAKLLEVEITAFTAAPTAIGLESCKTAWLKARNPYGQTEAFRFYGGPIDGEDGPEGQINAWPMDESYVDYTKTNPTSGIINNAGAFPQITKQALIDANENGGETNVATGFHAIEFLLWGQDLNANGPGNRNFTDYTSATNAARRITYLKVVTSLLIDDLQYLVDQWKDNSTYKTSFIDPKNADSSLTFIIRGIGSLTKGELAGERMTVALANRDQEDEHSCFSDNTHQDIKMNFEGIANVYTGTYKKLDGTTISGASIASLVEIKNKDKNNAVITQILDCRTKISNIQVPFDQAILTNTGNNVTNSINALRLLSDKMVDASFDIGIKVNF